MTLHNTSNYRIFNLSSAYFEKALTNFPAVHLVRMVLHHETVELHFNLFETTFVYGFSVKIGGATFTDKDRPSRI